MIASGVLILRSRLNLMHASATSGVNANMMLSLTNSPTRPSNPLLHDNNSICVITDNCGIESTTVSNNSSPLTGSKPDKYFETMVSVNQILPHSFRTCFA